MRRYPILGLMVLLLELATPGSMIAQTNTPSGPEFVTPDPAECTVDPRSIESVLALAATPITEPPIPAAGATPDIQIPEAVPADQQTVDAITATVREITACFNAGDLLRVMALVTDDYVVANFVGPAVFFGGLTPEQLETEFGGPPTPRLPAIYDAFRVLDVRVLPDGRVIAVTELSDPGRTMTVVQVFAEENGRYLADELLGVTATQQMGPPPGGTPGSATPPV